MMEKIFDGMIDSYVLNQIGISEDFLSIELSMALMQNIKDLYQNDALKSAKTGNGLLENLNKLVRSDKIFWLDRNHQNVSEDSFFDVIDLFVEYLNRTCYVGITSYEFHYALYEKGSFYERHLDSFKNNASRQFTMIFYLNENWQIADGGQLCIYPNNIPELISPNFGKSIFFKSSELEHEVMVSNKSRMSITGWFKVD